MNGYTWAVYPKDTGLAMIANGISGSDAVAQALVEAVMASEPGALFGTITSPGGGQAACRRARTPGKYVWRALHEDPSSRPASSHAEIQAS